MRRDEKTYPVRGSVAVESVAIAIDCIVQRSDRS